LKSTTDPEALISPASPSSNTWKNRKSSNYLLTNYQTPNSSLPSYPTKTITTSLSALAFSKSAESVNSTVAGDVFFLTHYTIPAYSLGPL